MAVRLKHPPALTTQILRYQQVRLDQVQRHTALRALHDDILAGLRVTEQGGFPSGMLADEALVEFTVCYRIGGLLVGEPAEAALGQFGELGGACLRTSRTRRLRLAWRLGAPACWSFWSRSRSRQFFRRRRAPDWFCRRRCRSRSPRPFRPRRLLHGLRRRRWRNCPRR